MGLIRTGLDSLTKEEELTDTAVAEGFGAI